MCWGAERSIELALAATKKFSLLAVFQLLMYFIDDFMAILNAVHNSPHLANGTMRSVGSGSRGTG